MLDLVNLCSVKCAVQIIRDYLGVKQSLISDSATLKLGNDANQNYRTNNV